MHSIIESKHTHNQNLRQFKKFGYIKLLTYICYNAKSTTYILLSVLTKILTMRTILYLSLGFITIICFSFPVISQQYDLKENPFISSTESFAKSEAYKVTSESEAISVEWVTSKEKRNAYFTVYRSYDGFKWSEVASIDAAGFGTSLEANKYRVVDLTPFYGNSLYRLTNTDKFGVSTTLEEVEVFHDGNTESSEALPNAVAKGSVIEVSNFNVLSGTNQINIIDANGNIVHTHFVKEDEVNSNVKLTIPSSLKTGIYELQIVDMDYLLSYTRLISVY
jgi:hypothetical protein